MAHLVFGIIAGAVFGAVAAGLMVPLPFPDKRQAMLAAFASRFTIGFIIPNLVLPLPLWLGGALVGLFLSLGDAIVTRSYVPILVVGTVGGAIIGLAVQFFG